MTRKCTGYILELTDEEYRALVAMAYLYKNSDNQEVSIKTPLCSDMTTISAAHKLALALISLS